MIQWDSDTLYLGIQICVHSSYIYISSSISHEQQGITNCYGSIDMMIYNIDLGGILLVDYN